MVVGGGGDACPNECRLDSGNPMAAGCEGNSVLEAAGCDLREAAGCDLPEAAGCGYCGTCGCALDVKRSPGRKTG